MGRDIIINPNRGLTGSTDQPYITFSGLTTGSINLTVEDDGSLTFAGDTGSLFGISDTNDGLLHSVNDVSGLPIFQVYSDDKIIMGKWDDPAMTLTSGGTVNINLGNVGGSSIFNLGVDGSGNIVTGTTTGDGIYTGSGSLSTTTVVDMATNTADLSFTTTGGGTNTLFLDDSSGNVGIGTSTPTTKLHIVGDGDTSVSDSLIVSDSGGTVNLIVEDGGNVGIGTAAPGATLDVNGNIQAGSWEGKTQSGIATAGFAGHSLSTYAWLQTSAGLTALNSSAGQTLEFRVGNSNQWVMDGNGKLQGEDSLGMKLAAYSDNGSSEYGLGIQNSNLQLIIPTGTTKFTWVQGTSASNVELMTLLDSGELGIGTSTPTGTLHINGVSGSTQFRLQQSFTPSSSGDTAGNVGSIAWDDNYIYTKTNTGWGRASLDYAF
jgi:hypothetical protein